MTKAEHKELTTRIGSFISDLRSKKGLTQSELAKMLNTSQSAVARMEKGDQNFTTEMLTKISEVLNKDIISVSSKSLNFRIEGGRRLHGSIKVRTSKNSAVGLLCASVLNRGKTVLRDMPKIEEVNRIVEVMESIGINIVRKGNDIEILPPEKIRMDKLDVKAAVKTRSALMFLAPLIHRIPKFKLPYPGGCKIGRRIVEPHLFALEKMGIEIVAKKGFYHVSRKKLKAADVVMYEPSDTATESAIMAAAKMPGKTVLRMVSANYMVQDLCFFLEKLGVKFEGIGTRTLVVYGNPDMDKTIKHCPSEDPIEAMLFLAIAIVTKSSIEIKGCSIRFLDLELLKLEKMGFKYKITRKYLSQNGKIELVDIVTYPSKLVALDHKIESLPYPGLNIDNLPFFALISTQAKGVTFIHDWVYENRAIYYTELNKLMAEVRLVDPHRVYIKGPTKLYAADVVSPPALRPSAIILIAMLGAKGTSILRNVYSINRGYEDLVNRLQTLGAKIEIMKGI